MGAEGEGLLAWAEGLITWVLTPRGQPGCQAGDTPPAVMGDTGRQQVTVPWEATSAAGLGSFEGSGQLLSKELPQEGYLHGQLLAVSELCVHLRLVCVRSCHANLSHTS